jgi:hypothetical protein
LIYTEINSVDVSGKVKRDSIRVPDELNERNQVSFVLRGTSSDRPAIGQEVIMYEDNTKTTKKFAGTIDDKVETEHGSFLKWNISCVGYETILDRFRAPESYTDQTAGYIIKDLVSQFVPSAEGITTTNVEDGPSIEKAVFGYDWTIAKCLDKLSDITGYFWYVDYDKDLHFEDRTKNTAPFDIDDDSDIYDFSVHNTREEYRNQQYIRAGNGVSSEISDSFVGNSEQRTWHVRKPIAEEPTITINPGEAGEVVLTGSDIGFLDVETGKKYYWNKGETHIVQDDGETLLTDSDTIKVTYTYLYPIRAFAQDVAEIEDREAIEGNSGIYTHVEDRKNINDSNAAEQEAIGLLAKYGEIPEKINYMTFEDGLQAGQLQTIVRNNHDIDGEYLISSVSFQPFGWNNGNIQYAYQVTALSGDYVGGWIKFFRKMADAGKEFVIRENEVIIKLKIFNEDLNITDSLTIDTDAYETRVDNAKSDYSQVSNLINIIGATETYPDKTAIVNGEGVTDSEDSNYHTKNIGGVTDTTDGTLDDINIIGVTDPSNAIAGGQWVYVEGWSNERY